MRTRILFVLLTISLAGNAQTTAQAPSISTVSTEVPKVSIQPIGDLKFNADIRLRHEHIDEVGADPRERQRIRARLGAKTWVSQDVELGFRIATGGTGITSTNQDLGDGFSNKEFGVDLAYATWHATKGLKATGGKMKIPFYRPMKSQLVWDSDVTPEGAAVQFKQKVMGSNLFANAGVFALDERKADENAVVSGGQVGFDSKKKSWGQLIVGGSAYFFSGLEDQALISSKSLGNTLSASATTLANDFQVYNAFAQYKTQLGPVPVSVGGDFIVNGAVDANNIGYIGMIKFGSKKAKVPVELGYSYRRVEADSTLGTLTDSDIFNGGTDGEGHLITGGYHFSKKASVGTSFFISQLGLDDPQDFFRAQADIKLKY